MFADDLNLDLVKIDALNETDEISSRLVCSDGHGHLPVAMLLLVRLFRAEVAFAQRLPAQTSWRRQRVPALAQFSQLGDQLVAFKK